MGLDPLLFAQCISYACAFCSYFLLFNRYFLDSIVRQKL